MITNIAGSIGGTTFKRSPSGIVMMNKNLGGSKSARLKNNYVFKLGNVFRRWTHLDESTKTAWNEYALTITFPDKFGNQKNLTGRELFIKCSGTLSLFNASITLPNDYSDKIPDFDITECYINLPAGEFNVYLTQLAWEGYVLLYIEKIPYVNYCYSNPKTKFFYGFEMNGDISFNYISNFLQRFPAVKAGESYRFFFIPISYNGIRTTPAYVDRIVET